MPVGILLPLCLLVSLIDATSYDVLNELLIHHASYILERMGNVFWHMHLAFLEPLGNVNIGRRRRLATWKELQQ